MTNFRFSIAIIVFFFFSKLPATGNDYERLEKVLKADAAELKKMLSDAMVSLKSKMDSTSGIGMYEIVNKHQIGKPKPKASEWEVGICGSNCIKISRKERDTEVLEVTNETYAFVLTRPKGGKFSIAGVQRRGLNLSDDLLIRDKMNSARYYLLDAYSYYGRTIWGLVGDPGFKVLKIEAVGDKSNDVKVRVEFDYTPLDKKFDGEKNIDDWTLKGAYLVFAPRKDWQLVEYGRPQYPRTITTLNEHPKNQLAFTDTAAARYFKADGTVDEESSIRCVKSSYDPILKEQFYLKHYGFPEPNFGSMVVWPWVLGCVFVGLICLFASRKLLRRST
jgi:hypothetical protein